MSAGIKEHVYKYSYVDDQEIRLLDASAGPIGCKSLQGQLDKPVLESRRAARFSARACRAANATPRVNADVKKAGSRNER